MNKIAILDTGYDSYEYEHQLFAEQEFELIIYDGPAGDHHLKIEFAREAVAQKGIRVANVQGYANHVVSTSHLAWYSENSMKELQLRAAHNMIDLLSGKTVDDELKPS